MFTNGITSKASLNTGSSDLADLSWHQRRSSAEVSSASLGIPQNPLYLEGHVLPRIASLHVPVSVGACFVELSVNCQVLLLASQQPEQPQALPLLPTQGHTGSVWQGDAQGARAGPLCSAGHSIGAASEPPPFLRVIRSVSPNCRGESPACLFPQSFTPCDAETLVPPQDTAH